MTDHTRQQVCRHSDWWNANKKKVFTAAACVAAVFVAAAGALAAGVVAAIGVYFFPWTVDLALVFCGVSSTVWIIFTAVTTVALLATA